MEKDEGRLTVTIYVSLIDESSPMAHAIKQFARMSFESIDNETYAFTSKVLRRFDFHKSKVLSQLGFLEITHDGYRNVKATRCLHNQILEYCAALHATCYQIALQNIIKTFSSAGMIISEGLLAGHSYICCGNQLQCVVYYFHQ